MMTKSVLCVLLLLAGCAKAPSNIVAADIGPAGYAQRSCGSLNAERVDKQTQLDRLSAIQEETANRDKAWMVMVHVPVASLQNGDREPEIASLKGHLQAIDAARSAKGCYSSPN